MPVHDRVHRKQNLGKRFDLYTKVISTSRKSSRRRGEGTYIETTRTVVGVERLVDHVLEVEVGPIALE